MLSFFDNSYCYHSLLLDTVYMFGTMCTCLVHCVPVWHTVYMFMYLFLSRLWEAVKRTTKVTSDAPDGWSYY